MKRKSSNPQSLIKSRIELRTQKQFAVSRKRVASTPKSRRYNSNKKSTNISLTLHNRFKKTKADELTEDICDIIKKKAIKIRADHKTEINNKQEFTVKLVNIKDSTKVVYESLEKCKKKLIHLKCIKKKLETDCNLIKKDIEEIEQRIKNVRDNDLTALLKEQALDINKQKGETIKEIKELIEKRKGEEFKFSKEESRLQEQIDKQVKEIEGLKNNLCKFKVNESYRLKKLKGNKRSIDISISGIKSLMNNQRKYSIA